MFKDPIPEDAVTVISLSNLAETEAEVTKVFLQKLAEAGVTEIKRYMGTGIFKQSSGGLIESVQSSVEDGAVVWFSDAPHAKVLEKGCRPRHMLELKDRVIPITVYKYGGQMKVFRKATLKALLAGKFFHPGIVGKDFFKRGIRVATSQIPRLWVEARRAVMLMV